MIRWRVFPMRFSCTALLPTFAAAQASSPAGPPQTLTLEQAIQYATDHYPTIRAALEQVNATTAGVDVARSAYLPHLDSLWQSNRGTANNTFGQVLPQSVIPSLTGPVLSSTSADSVWGSAVGALFSWEPFDFGLRHSSVVTAEAALAQAKAGETLTRLDIQNAVANAFLTVAAAQRAVFATQADLERRNVLLQAVHTLVTNQLRPGADQSRIEAERAAAQTHVIQAQQSLAIAQATLSRVLGSTAGGLIVVADALTERVPAGDMTPTAAANHPLALVRQASVDQAPLKKMCSPIPTCRECWCSRVCSHAGAGRIPMERSMVESTDSNSNERTGPPASRFSFQTSSIFRV